MVEETNLKVITSSCHDSEWDSPSETSPLLDGQPTTGYEGNMHSSLSVPSRSILSCAVMCILITELCERLTYYGISGNLLLFLIEKNQLNLSATSATIVQYVFQGTCYILPLFGGWLADSVSGKFLAILFGVIVYLIGAILIPLGSFDSTVSWDGQHLVLDKTFKRGFFLCGLFLVAIGTGGIKANVSPFGADQVSKKGPKAVQTFFIWFYFFINIGSSISLSIVVYVQQNISYFYGFLIPTLSILITLVIFLSGKNNYTIRPPTGSILSTIMKIVKEALKKYRRPTLSCVSVPHWLDRAKTCYGGSYSDCEVEDVKKICRLILIFVALILYWTVYGQINTSMVYQGKYMDISLGSNFKIPIASLGLLDVIGVFVFIPIMDKLVYPMLSKFNIHLSKLQRIGIGMVIAASNMVCAGVIELYRTEQCCMEQQRSSDPNKTLVISNITIFYQVPQYTLVGLSEVFTVVTALELAYMEAPKSLQGVVMGINCLTSSLGSYLGVAVLGIVNAISGSSGNSNKWYPDKDHINNGKLANYFFLMAGLGFVNFILYIFVARNFKPSKTETPDRNILESVKKQNGLPSG